MRRTEFATGIQQLHDALVESQLQSLLASMLEDRSEEPATSQVLTVLKEYSLQARQFNEAAHRLAHLLNLDKLESPDTWSQLIDQRDPAFVRRQHERVSVVTDYLPQVAALLQHSARQTLEAAGLTPDEAGRLTVLIVEQEDRLSSPQRIAELLTGLEKLYEVCDAVADVKGDKLSVLSCESGADKAFEMVGTPEVITELKNLILSMWDRVVFFRDRDLPERIERVAESLFVHERINSLEQAIGPEHAEILRRALKAGVTKFMEAGALIPEIEERAQHDPRRLMTPEPKLLVSSATEAPAPQSAGEQSAEIERETPSPAEGVQPEQAAPATDRETASPTEEPGGEPTAPLSATSSDNDTYISSEPSAPGETASPEAPDDESPAPEQAAPASDEAAESLADEPESPDDSSSEDDRDGVMEVLEAIADRHEEDEPTGEERAEAAETPEPEQQPSRPESASAPGPEPAPNEPAPGEPDSPPEPEDAPDSPVNAPEPTDAPDSLERDEPSAAEDREESLEADEEDTMKGLNRMFDRIGGGGEHLFGNPDEGDESGEEEENRN
jgi:hypothetical protein